MRAYRRRPAGLGNRRRTSRLAGQRIARHTLARIFQEGLAMGTGRAVRDARSPCTMHGPSRGATDRALPSRGCSAQRSLRRPVRKSLRAGERTPCRGFPSVISSLISKERSSKLVDADRAPHAVHGHHLLVQQRRSDTRRCRTPTSSSFSKLRCAGVLHHRLVGALRRRHHHAHVDAALRPPRRTHRSRRAPG